MRSRCERSSCSFTTATGAPLAGEATEEWRRLAGALAARASGPLLFVDGTPRNRAPASSPGCRGPEPLPTAVRMAGAILEDRLAEALAEPATDPESLIWRAVALRRGGRLQEARRAFRAVGTQQEHPLLYQRALRVLRSGGGGFRWAAESAAHLLARGCWDSIWFVDACAAAHTGLLSPESAA